MVVHLPCTSWSPFDACYCIVRAAKWHLWWPVRTLCSSPLTPDCSSWAVWHQRVCHHLCLRWDRCQGVERGPREVWGKYLGAPRWNWLIQLQWVPATAVLGARTRCARDYRALSVKHANIEIRKCVPCHIACTWLCLPLQLSKCERYPQDVKSANCYRCHCL